MNLNFERAGGGDPVLLIHGLGGHLGQWRPVAELLAADHEVLAVDLPGFGRSPMPGDPALLSAPRLAATLAEFCREQGVARPRVAGNSLGAWVGLEMARAGEASSVVGISAAGLWRQPPGPRRYDTYRAGRALRPLVATLLRSKRGRAWMLRRFVARPDRVALGEARELIYGYLNAPGYPAASEYMRGHALEAPEEISVPVTLAWGEEDRLVGRPSRSRRPPGARYVEMPGWGHTPSWDDPRGVAALIAGQEFFSAQFPGAEAESQVSVRRDS
jgi:pimeloyl-ACP methyl ester carboxylesterase